MTEQDLQQIAALIRSETAPINKRLDAIQEQLNEIKEDTQITREVVNLLGEWAENASAVIGVPYPVKH